MKTLIAALALTVAAPTLAHAIPPCRVSPRTICTIDSAADQRRIPMPAPDAYRFPVVPLHSMHMYLRGGPAPPPMSVSHPSPPKVQNNIFIAVPEK